MKSASDNVENGPGLLEAAWRYKLLIAVATLAAFGTGFGASFLQPTMYEGEARLLLADPRNQTVLDTRQTFLDPSRYVRNQAQLVQSTAVAARTLELIDENLTTRELSERVSAEASVELDLITVRALSPTAEGAAALANATAEAYQEVVTEDVRRNAGAAIAELEESKQQLQSRIDGAERILRQLPDDATAQAERDAAVAQLIEVHSRSEQIAVDAALYGSGVELFEAAEIPEVPAQPKPLRNALVAAVLGLLGSWALAWWRAEQTQAAEGRHDPAAVLRAPLLGEIPDFASVGVEGHVPTVTAPHTAPAEAYQFIIASLDFALRDSSGRTVLVTSASPGDGKTVTALNLAIAASDGRRAMLVDADHRMQGLTRLTKVQPSPGLTDLADEGVPIEGCIARAKLDTGLQLPVVPRGTEVADAAGFFRTPAFRQAMRRLKDRGDFVVIDSPPLLAVADTSALATQADGIVLVVRKGTPLRHLAEIRQRLDFIGTPLLGYVFNRSMPGGLGYGRYGSYRYGYGYGYGYGNGARTPPLLRRLKGGLRQGRQRRGSGKPRTPSETTTG